MVKLNVPAPVIWHVAMIALVTQLSGMGVLSTMAGNAGCTQFLGSNIGRMAGVATEFVMCSWQYKSAIAHMVEL